MLELRCRFKRLHPFGLGGSAIVPGVDGVLVGHGHAGLENAEVRGPELAVKLKRKSLRLRCDKNSMCLQLEIAPINV